MSIYIFSLFYYNKSVLHIVIVLKYFVFLCNIANFVLIIVIVYTAKDKGKILTGKKICLYLFYELIFILKFYFHVLSIQRTEKDVCNGNDYSNRDSCWVTLRWDDEDGQEFSR